MARWFFPGWPARRSLILLIMVLTAGCQAQSRSLTPMAEPTSSQSPSAVSPQIPTANGVGYPSPTPEPTSPPPTADPREFTVAAPKADVWDEPADENSYWHLQTQVILGEKVLVTGRDGDWSQIAAVDQPSKKNPLGYPGWIRSKSLASGWSAAQQFVVVMKPHASLRTGPDGSPINSLLLDTRLPIVSTQPDWIQVRLPDGTDGWLAAGDVRLTDDLHSRAPADGLLALAQALIGVPYRWGGTTTDALDCSGLTYRVFHAYGILLSRDADDQALGGELVARKDLRRGDLIFVSEQSGGAVTHMSIYWGEDTVLDSATELGVTIRTFPDFFKFYYWITARRYLP